MVPSVPAQDAVVMPFTSSRLMPTLRSVFELRAAVFYATGCRRLHHLCIWGFNKYVCSSLAPRSQPSLTQTCIALLAADNTDELQSFATFLLQMLPTKPDLSHMFIRSSLTKVEDALSGLKDAQSGWLRHCRSYSNACKGCSSGKDGPTSECA